MIKYKNFIKNFIIITLILPFLGIFNYMIDPFQQYRVKTFYPIVFFDERYQNAGFLKNFDYDSIILGTSMTENFLIKEIEKKLGYSKLIKLSLTGGRANEQKIILETAIKMGKVKNILWGLDTFSFIDKYNNPSKDMPLYLYDNNIFNDYKYLFSLDTTRKSIEAISRIFKNPKDLISLDYNKMYQWQHKYEDKFTSQEIKKSWENRNTKFIKKNIQDQSFINLKNNFDFTFLNIIKDNPQIKFKIFFPPYSILTFKVLEERSTLEETLKFKKYLYDIFIELDNVDLYDFQLEKNITYNLNNYKDLSHYHQKINTWMIEEISNNKYLIDENNLSKNIDILRIQVKDYYIKEFE